MKENLTFLHGSHSSSSRGHPDFNEFNDFLAVIFRKFPDARQSLEACLDSIQDELDLVTGAQCLIKARSKLQQHSKKLTRKRKLNAAMRGMFMESFGNTTKKRNLLNGQKSPGNCGMRRPLHFQKYHKYFTRREILPQEQVITGSSQSIPERYFKGGKRWVVAKGTTHQKGSYTILRAQALRAKSISLLLRGRRAEFRPTPTTIKKGEIAVCWQLFEK